MVLSVYTLWWVAIHNLNASCVLGFKKSECLTEKKFEGENFVAGNFFARSWMVIKIL